MCMAAFINVVGNCMVLTVIIRHRGMRTRTNLFLVNLAVADIFVGTLVVPFSVGTMIKNGWIVDEGSTMYNFSCGFNTWMNSFCITTSIHTLMYISIHKYFSIVKPLGTPLKLRTILMMMAAAWVWAFLNSFLVVTQFGTEYKVGASQCGPKYPASLQAYIVHIEFQATTLVIPFVIMLFCYGRMFKAIKEHTDRMKANTTVEADVILLQQKKVTITMFIVLAGFFFTAFLPYVVYAFYVAGVRQSARNHGQYPDILFNPLVSEVIMNYNINMN